MLLALSSCAVVVAEQTRWVPLLDPHRLRYSGFRKELNLSPDQEKKIASVWLRWAKLGATRPSEEQKQKIYGLIDGLVTNLTPAQKKRYREVAIQMASPFVAAHPDVFKAIGLTPSQRTQLMRIQDESLRAGARGGNNAIVVSTMQQGWAVLTAAQKKKLKALGGKPADLNAIRNGIHIAQPQLRPPPLDIR
jgi:hypothetical protein